MNVQVKEVAVDVKAVMDTWTRQSGFPIVHVSVIGRYVKLRQERFLFDRRADKTQPPSDYKYASCHVSWWLWQKRIEKLTFVVDGELGRNPNGVRGQRPL